MTLAAAHRSQVFVNKPAELVWIALAAAAAQQADDDAKEAAQATLAT